MDSESAGRHWPRKARMAAGVSCLCTAAVCRSSLPISSRVSFAFTDFSSSDTMPLSVSSTFTGAAASVGAAASAVPLAAAASSGFLSTSMLGLLVYVLRTPASGGCWSGRAAAAAADAG